MFVLCPENWLKHTQNLKEQFATSFSSRNFIGTSSKVSFSRVSKFLPTGKISRFSSHYRIADHIDLTSKTEQNKTDNGTAQKLHRSKTFSPVRKPGTPISPLCRSKLYSRKTPTEINRQVLSWQQEMSLKYPMYRYI